MKDIAMQRVKVSDITIGDNFRKTMDKDALKDLTENVKAYGVVEPVLVRREKDGKYHLIAGARRIAATTAAGIKDIPARIIEASEEESQMFQAIENLHRENLNAIDEAEQFQKLLKEKGEKELSGAVNKTLKYVHRALALLDLDKDIQQMIRKGEIKPAHGHLILRVPEKAMPKVIEFVKTQVKFDGAGNFSVKNLQRHIDSTYGTEMSSAVFDTAACAHCAHYTKNQTMLFDDGDTGLCDNAECFKKKTEDFRKALAEKAEKKDFKGMKFLGIKGGARNYMNGMQRTVGKTGLVIDEKFEKNPIIKKLREKDPSKFGFILNPTTNKPELVLLDRSVVIKATPEAQPVDWDKEHFIGDAGKAVVMSALKTLDCASEKVFHGLMVNLADELGDTDVAEELFGKNGGDAKKLAAFKNSDLLRLIVGSRNRQASDLVTAIEPYLPKLKGEIAAAKKVALDAWPAEKTKRDAAKLAEEAKEKAAAAKNKPSKKAAKEEAEDEEAED